MSAEAQPISPERFAAALPNLPTSNLHAKAAELLNSLSHLHASNAQLLPFANPADRARFDVICEESIKENLAVMQRMKERLDILRAEVEARGGIWVWERLAEEVGVDDKTAAVNGELNNAQATDSASSESTGSERPQQQSGRYSDEELARRMAERMQEDDDNDSNGAGGGGLHL